MAPPKILTNNYWPVRQKILSHLSFYDKRALSEAFPGLKIQEDATYQRQELLSQVVELGNMERVFVCYQNYGHSHFAHPLLNAILEKQRMSGSERAKKTREINQYISDISEDINEIPSIGTELCLTSAPKCWLRGYTALHVAAMWDDVATAKRLVDKGADMYRLGERFPQLRPLVVAANHGSMGVFKFLAIQMSKDKERRTEETNRTALEMAENLDHWDYETIHQIIQLLN